MHPGTTARYLYSKGALNRIPPSLQDLLTGNSAISPTMVATILREPFVPRRDRSVEDESIYNFMSRRFSKSVADNIIDPIVSGIYAGDMHRLSVRSCFTSFWEAEATHGSVLLGLFRSRPTSNSEKHSEDVNLDRLKGASIWSLRDGLGTLPAALTSKLMGLSNVRMYPTTACTALHWQCKDRAWGVSNPCVTSPL